MKAMIIGIGNIAQVHIKCLIHLNVEIVALCDIDKQRCISAAEKYDLNCKIYTDYREMIINEKADVVHICTPHYLHTEMIIDCMRNNLNVFTEKPVAISNAQMELLRTEIEKNENKLGICFQNRFSPAVIFVKEYLKDKNISGMTASLSWDRGYDYYADSNWKGKSALEGGSVLINQAIHTIDLLQYLKEMPISLVCHTSTDVLKDVIETEESAFVLFDYADGTRAILFATNTSTTYFDVTIQIQTSDGHNILIVGENLYIDGTEIELEQSNYYFGKKAWGTNHLTCIQAFYDSINNKELFPIGYEDAENAMKLLFCCYESKGKKYYIKDECK